MSLEPGRTLAHYRIVCSLGAGGMGEVYRARDSRLERDVALTLQRWHRERLRDPMEEQGFTVFGSSGGTSTTRTGGNIRS